MKRIHLVGLAFLIGMIGFLGVTGSASAIILPHTDVSDVLSDPDHHAHAFVSGIWYFYGPPYKSVHHHADSINVPNGIGWVQYIAWNKTGEIVYNITHSFAYSESYDSGKLNIIWVAETIVKAGGETAIADIGPPGAQ